MGSGVHSCINVVWIAVFAVWAIGGLTTKQTARAQSRGSRLIQTFFFILAFLLLFRNEPRTGWFGRRFLPPSLWGDYTGLALTVAGAGFAIWARFALGRNWSGTVTVKQDHTLIRTGPYAVVRHPIYAGFLLAILGTTIAIGEIRGLAATVSALIGMKLKAQLEEEFMMEQFGEEYAQYKREVKGIIPFVW